MNEPELLTFGRKHREVERRGCIVADKFDGLVTKSLQFNKIKSRVWCEGQMKIVAGVILLAACLLPTIPLSFVQAEQDITVHDKDMTVSDFVDIGYPPLARQTRTQGVVVVRAQLDKDGRVTDVVAISGSELLAPASVENAKKWRFHPNAQRAVVIVYNFRMPFAACKSDSIHSFSMLQAPNFVTVTGCETSL
jgi:TonB family protein